MLLELIHETHFDYSEPVNGVHMELRLTPLTDRSQHLLQHRPRLTPPRPVRQYVDGFGNIVSYFNVLGPVERVEVVFESMVETYPDPYRGEPLPGQGDSPVARLGLYDYLRPTPITDWGPELVAFAEPLSGLKEQPPGKVADELCSLLYSTFRYDGDVTDASTPITGILTHRAGVCQDFAHLMIATCRYLGFPTRYVSGYVLPGDGSEAAASHAWCEVFDPARGWLGVDPTHNTRAEERYVRLGIGRDYRDVAPNRGIYRGAGVEEMHVRVRLRPVTPDALAERNRSLQPAPRVTSGGSRQRRVAETPSVMQQVMHSQQQQQQ